MSLICSKKIFRETPNKYFNSDLMITKRIVIESINGVKITTFLCLNKDRKPFVTNDFRKASMSEKVIKLIFKMRDRGKAERTRLSKSILRRIILRTKLII